MRRERVMGWLTETQLGREQLLYKKNEKGARAVAEWVQVQEDLRRWRLDRVRRVDLGVYLQPR